VRLHPQFNLSVENSYLLTKVVVFFLDCIKYSLLVNIKHILGNYLNLIILTIYKNVNKIYNSKCYENIRFEG
jgi:hypothetical protein